LTRGFVRGVASEKGWDRGTDGRTGPDNFAFRPFPLYNAEAAKPIEGFRPEGPAVRPRLLAFVVLQIPFLYLGGSFAYHYLFSSFLLHDDEGYLMMSVRYLLRGDRIYDDVPILYGPAFFFCKWLVHGLLHVPLTYHAVRMQTLVVWLASVFGVGLFVVLVARSIALALAAQLVALGALAALSNEPGHPQLVALLVVLFLVLSVAQRRWPDLTMFLLGAVAATVLCLKINLGIFVLAALGAAVLAKSRPTAVFLTLRAGAILLLAVPALAHR